MSARAATTRWACIVGGRRPWRCCATPTVPGDDAPASRRVATHGTTTPATQAPAAGAGRSPDRTPGWNRQVTGASGTSEPTRIQRLDDSLTTQRDAPWPATTTLVSTSHDLADIERPGRRLGRHRPRPGGARRQPGRAAARFGSGRRVVVDFYEPLSAPLDDLAGVAPLLIDFAPADHPSGGGVRSLVADPATHPDYLCHSPTDRRRGATRHDVERERTGVAASRHPPQPRRRRLGAGYVPPNRPGTAYRAPPRHGPRGAAGPVDEH